MAALVLTYDADATQEKLRERIAARGIDDVHIVETQRYPGEIGLTVHQDQGRLTGWLHLPDADVPLDRVRAVWTHRWADATGLPAAWPDDVRRTTLAEAEAVLVGVLEALPGALRINPAPLDRQGQHKLLLHEVARRVGLEVPATYAGNDAAAARAFRGDRSLVVKHLTAWAPPGTIGASALFTKRLVPAHLDDAASVQLSPLLLQEEIGKQVELRVVIVGRRVFCGSIDPSTVPGAEVDWRTGHRVGPSPWRRDALPPDVEARVLALMDALGLQYGAADVIRTPDGRHVFLEVNPSGGFLWIDRLHDGAILDAFLDLLRDPALARPTVFPTASPVAAS
ncbi:MAG TPA: hypothetical protein PKA64_17855 [Myxococcota bacterium]|nr:hypothetical protein [Myxococcota bacterium]